MTPSNKPTKTLVIKAGETGVLKSTATIISVGVLGNADAESNCANVDEAIANAENYQCYEFVWEGESLDSGSNQEAAWDEEDVYFDSLEVGDTIYNVGIRIKDIVLNPGIVGTLKQTVPASIMRMGDNSKGNAWYHQLGDNKITMAICFLALPSVAATMRIKFRNPMANGNAGADPLYYIYPRDLSKDSADPPAQPTWCTCVSTASNPSA